jgi:CubicO group peptidase (beta-lactamase class C family)
LETPTMDVFPLAVRVESYSLEPLMFQPDSEWLYSNAGINTVARIIEVVSGMSYERFLQERLFDPLGMKDTTFWPTETQLRRLAKAYKPGDDGKGLQETPITQLRQPLSDRAHRYPMPAGGLFSTAADLARFCQMLLAGGVYGGHRYLGAAAIHEMTTNQVPQASLKSIKLSGGNNGYGLGWFTSASGAFSHEGAYSTSMRIDPKKGLITIWLVQHDGFPGDGAKSFDTFQSAVSKRFGSMTTAAAR